MKNQVKPKDAYYSFLNKLVKVVYKEYNGVQIGRGLLIEVHPDLLILKGDISRQGIPRGSVIKVSALNEHNSGQDNGRKRK